jgi:hypothetical protein
MQLSHQEVMPIREGGRYARRSEAQAQVADRGRSCLITIFVASHTAGFLHVEAYIQYLCKIQKKARICSHVTDSMASFVVPQAGTRQNPQVSRLPFSSANPEQHPNQRTCAWRWSSESDFDGQAPSRM